MYTDPTGYPLGNRGPTTGTCSLTFHRLPHPTRSSRGLFCVSTFDTTCPVPIGVRRSTNTNPRSSSTVRLGQHSEEIPHIHEGLTDYPFPLGVRGSTERTTDSFPPRSGTLEQENGGLPYIFVYDTTRPTPLGVRGPNNINPSSSSE